MKQIQLPKPKQHLKDWKPVQLSGEIRALLLSDIHVPYFDYDALLIALDEGKKRKPTHIILNGDTIDCHAVSRWEKDPRERNFKDEIESCRQVLQAIRDTFPNAKIVFKFGNHEERYVSYMRQKAPELLGLADFDLESILRFDELGITSAKDCVPIRIGKLNIIHGHEYKFSISNPVNPARGFYLRAKVHCIGGHLHQHSNHSEKNMEGKVISTWSTGCLCNMHPDYAPLNNWSHGFAFVSCDKAGSFHVENMKIINGRVY
jgi:predicted phosphodiesterase